MDSVLAEINSRVGSPKVILANLTKASLFLLRFGSWATLTYLIQKRINLQRTYTTNLERWDDLKSDFNFADDSYFRGVKHSMTDQRLVVVMILMFPDVIKESLQIFGVTRRELNCTILNEKTRQLQLGNHPDKNKNVTVTIDQIKFANLVLNSVLKCSKKAVNQNVNLPNKPNRPTHNDVD
jgi:hypothetical protein